MMHSDSTLSVKDATGRHISLLNDQQQAKHDQDQEHTSMVSFNSKRKYHCVEIGCNKSFTTSGHLARHHRIHTGEKNFHCLHPGCPSRFSRQDNMMQHYRTHLSPKSRRQHQHQHSNNSKSKRNKEHPHLHCHTMVGSEEHSDMHPLVDTTDLAMIGDRTMTRSRRATTLPCSFQPTSPINDIYTTTKSQTSSSPPRQMHHQHPHWFPSPRPSLSNLIKPLPMEPVSTRSTCMDASPTFMTNHYRSTSPNGHLQQSNRNHPFYQPYPRRPQRAHSTSSTCSSTSSSSFLSPRPLALSPPPLVDPTDVIYPKHFIQLPPPPLTQQQDTHHIVTNNHHEQGLSRSAHTVSIFG
ncbi:hypothetical protein BC941DRAFT_467582 [Chlamydoabsidia padenii]|nr:hypothetical protein BC941DRAFT_467582 [Chlamydoabsidia padenii]